MDIRRVAGERAKAEGIDLETALWDVVKALLEAGRKGDVAAAKLVMDRLCEADPVTLKAELAHTIGEGCQSSTVEDLAAALREVGFVPAAGSEG